ncbi:MAG TPA: hypothetical protein ENO20_09410 [Bacteroides sp.]|nr:hypothetical protein [Bacteroides sp.]
MAKLAEYIGWRILKRKRKGVDREVRVHNFGTAKSAAILFDTTVENSFPVIHEFRKFIDKQGIRCSAFGYVPEKEIPQEMLLRKNYSFITRKDLNWYRRPRGEVTENFYSCDPDMLIDFTFQSLLELQFLVQLSTARFKIGCYTEQENDYDLMINITGKECEIGYFAEQVKHYISMLHPSK